MKRLMSAVILSTLFLTLPAFAQSPDEYVRNSKTVPNFLDQKSGWLHDPTKDERKGNYVTESYKNEKEGLFAYVYVIQIDGLRQECLMEYGSMGVSRAAIKVDEKWYLGKAPFYDNHKSVSENDFKSEGVVNNEGQVVGVKITLDTVDGLKELIVK